MLVIPDPFQDLNEQIQQEALPQEEDIPEGFQPEEWALLQQEDYDILERLMQLDRSLWWECGACGILIEARLRLIHDNLYPPRENFYHPGTRDEHVAFVYHMQQMIQEFFDINNFLYRILTHDLLRVCVRNNLLAILQFADNLSRELIRLRDFHDRLYEHSLPQEQPFPEVQSIMVSWAPYLYERLDDCAKQLLDKSQRVRGAWSDARLHSSIFPSNVPKFFILLQQLQQRYGTAY
ncbi:MAG: hypothetical protein D6820_07190 [Lentisphaerae bacterium]|nr:MAG: hypothetical protein D6820_07190 [Lentisphaerota bacterium]